MAQRILHLILLIGAALFGVSVILFFIHRSCPAQTTYYGPSTPMPGLIKVDIQAYDDPEIGGVKIEEVIFNNQRIALKPPGILGYRGGGSFQMAEGSYPLIWKVSREKMDWPRTLLHKEKVQVSAHDVWIQVSIRGENMEIH